MRTSFAQLFKKYRLKAEFGSLSEFGSALAEKGFIYEDSIFSHWQKGTRIPNNRKLILAIAKIFYGRNVIQSINDANDFMASSNNGYLTVEELEQLFENNSIRTRKKSFITEINNMPFYNQNSWNSFIIKNENDLKKTYREALTAKELFIYENLGVNRGKFLDEIRFDYAMEKNSKLKIQELIDASFISKKAVQPLMKYSQYSHKFVNPLLKINPTDILIYEGKVAIITIKETVQGTVFYNKKNYYDFKGLFEFLWKQL